MKLLTDEELRVCLSTDLFRLIGSVADELGYECYTIGGYVRDLFLERHSSDIDCVVVGSGIKMAEAVADALYRRCHHRPHVSTFANFGTAQIRLTRRYIDLGGDEEVELEFVGARKESYSHDSRKPVVEDGTLEDDQNRRDFTINAMALCLNHDRFGELVDPFEGLYDLEDGIIRTPLDPDITFSDDPLRMLRCIRFATRFNFLIENETFEALERNKGRIKIISAERIIDELNKILLCDHPSKGFVDLERCGLLEIILPEVHALEGVQTVNGRGHKDNFYHTLEVLENVVKAQKEAAAQTAAQTEETETEQPAEADRSEPEKTVTDPLWLRWAALLHDIGKPKCKQWDGKGWTFHNHDHVGKRLVTKLFKRMKLPTDERMKYVETLVGMHMRPQAIADDEVTDSAVRRLVHDVSPYIDDLMMLCSADITSKNLLKKARFQENYRAVKEKIADLKARDYVRLLQPVITGDEIMQLFHLSPGPVIGELKKAMKDAILDNQVENEHDALMELLTKKAKELGVV